jgi:hypothetical protein
MARSFPSTAPNKLRDEDRKPDPGPVSREAVADHRHPAQISRNSMISRIHNGR